MMIYEFTAAHPTGWVGPRDCPIILRGDRHLHHVAWSLWNVFLCTGTVWLEALLPEQLSLSSFEPHLDNKELCPEVLWSYGCRLIPSQGSAAFWHVLCVSPSLPLCPGHSSQCTSSCFSEKLISRHLSSVFRIFEVSPTSSSASFDLAMTNKRWKWSKLGSKSPVCFLWLHLVIL